MAQLNIVIQYFEGKKIIHEIMFIIANNNEFTRGPEIDTSIRAQCSARLRGILGSRLYQEALF